MYVADVTSVAELEQLLDEARTNLASATTEAEFEQAQWDIEDIEDRIDDLLYESTYANKPIPGYNNNTKGTK
jgi:hypothetical protein